VRIWLRPRRLLPLLALLLAAGAVTAGLLLATPSETSVAGPEATPSADRRPAPELEGEVLVPPPVTIAELRGKPVVVNFWASWCVPCREEAPHLARFDREMKERARLVGVDFQDVRSDALAFVREFGWRFPNRRDPNGALASRYGLVGLPTTYVLDAEGRVAKALSGAQTFGTLVRAVEELE
jgi:cytochrome c biogenesis protein CcmG, thiol:disulfide interchange protein DsbE